MSSVPLFTDVKSSARINPRRSTVFFSSLLPCLTRPGGTPEWSDCLSRPVNELIFPTLGVEGGGSVDKGDVAEKSDEQGEE